VSAAEWRKAMNTDAGRSAWPGTSAGRLGGRRAALPVPGRPQAVDVEAAPWGRALWRHVGVRHVLVLFAVLAYPWVATPFFTFQIGAQSLALGLVALSLTFLAGYGGMVSLAQMTVAGIAGYMFAIFATSGTDISLRWPWGLAVLLALVIATACGTLIGWFSVRT
jgi:branched-chain amino acid transport system permease protein